MTIILDNDNQVYRVHSLEIVKAIAKELKDTQQVISAIRFVRYALTGMDLSEARAFVESL